MRKLKDYTPTQFMADDSHYDKAAADYAVNFIECLAHTKGTWAGKPFELIDWQERIIRDLFGVIKRVPAGNIKPDKEKSTEKIDGTVATIMALDRAIRCGNDTGDSIYDERDLFVL